MCENVVCNCFVATHQGRREYMEDFVCIRRKQEVNKSKWNDDCLLKCSDTNFVEYFAVFDGHGGSDAANFAHNYLLDEMTKQTGS